MDYWKIVYIDGEKKYRCSSLLDSKFEIAIVVWKIFISDRKAPYVNIYIYKIKKIKFSKLQSIIF